jgi:hypothetical protein
MLIGCAEQPGTVGEITVTEADSAGVRTVTISGPVTALPEWSLSEVPLTDISGNAAPFLGRVGEVAFFGERQILVYDRQSAELRSFASDGQVVQLLTGAGDGPGEIRALTQLSVTSGDTVYAFDIRHNRISVFGAGGALRTTIPVRPEFAGPETLVRDAWALGTDRYLLYGYGLGPGESGRPTDPPHRAVRDAIIQVVSADGIERATAIHFNGGYVVRHAGGASGSPFSNRPFVAVNAGRILHGSGLTYELTVRDLDLRPLLVIRWLGWQQPLTASMIETLRGPMAASIHELRAIAPDAADRLTDALFHTDVLPEALPALGSALLDENGRIWVAQFRPSDDLPMAMAGGYEQWHEDDVWHVLDSDGSPMARVRLPPRTRLLDVRSDRVVVVTRDDLDVEHVRVLAIDARGEAR